MAVDAPAADGLPARPRLERARLPGGREATKEDHRGVRAAQRGPHLVAASPKTRPGTGALPALSRANLAGTAEAALLTQALADHVEGPGGPLSGLPEGELAGGGSGRATGQGRGQSPEGIRCAGSAAAARRSPAPAS